MTRLVSFNVCSAKGLLGRAAQWVPDHALATMLGTLEADVACFQETKILLLDMPRELAVVPGYTAVFTSARGRPGYAGVAFYVKSSMRIYKAEEGLTGWLRPAPGREPYRLDPATSVCPEMYADLSEHEGLQIDVQNRVLTLDLGACVVIGLYCPADSQGNMSEYKETFFALLDLRVHRLRAQGRQVVVMGDLNVAREPLDSAPLVEELTRLRQPVDRDAWLYANPPRAIVNNWVLRDGFVDTGRALHPTRARMFSCWDQQKNCRPANFGSRIDYVLCSEGLRCTAADVLSELVGSDHCPIYADLDLGPLLPQRGHPLPPLAQRVVDKFPKSMDFFLKRKRDPGEAPGEAPGPSAKRSPTQEDPPREQTSASPGVASIAPTSSTTNAGDSTPIAGNMPNTSSALAKPTSSVSSSSAAKRASKVAKQGSVAAMFGAKSSQWQAVDKKKAPPLCMHGEPCILMRSNKPPRKGESFWVCGRPSGGKINSGMEYRCKTFIWDADR